MRKVLSVPTIQRLGLKFDGPSFIDNAQYMEDVNQVWQRRSVFAVEEWFRTPAHTWFTTRTPGIITPSFRSLLVRSVELTMAKKKAEIPSVEENPLGFHRRYQVIKHGETQEDPDATYIVLRVDSNGDDRDHIEFSRAAVRRYCEQVFRRPPEHPLRKMAEELWFLINQIEADEGEV